MFQEKKGKLAAKEPVGARLQEIGPRFTLRLRSLQVRAASQPYGCRFQKRDILWAAEIGDATHLHEA